MAWTLHACNPSLCPLSCQSAGCHMCIKGACLQIACSVKGAADVPTAAASSGSQLAPVLSWPKEHKQRQSKERPRRGEAHHSTNCANELRFDAPAPCRRLLPAPAAPCRGGTAKGWGHKARPAACTVCQPTRPPYLQHRRRRNGRQRGPTPEHSRRAQRHVLPARRARRGSPCAGGPRGRRTGAAAAAAAPGSRRRRRSHPAAWQG